MEYACTIHKHNFGKIEVYTCSLNSTLTNLVGWEGVDSMFNGG